MQVFLRFPGFLNASAVAVVAFAGFASAEAWASPSPCEAPETFVRRADLVSAPLSRPYVLAGIAAVSLRHDGSHSWLELAANSADDARRRLSPGSGVATAHAAGSDAPILATWGDRVWLRCPSPA